MSREAAFSALFAAVSAAYPWGLASRRMKLWGEVPSSLRPAFFQLESGPESYQWPSPAAPKRTFEAKFFLYFASQDPTTPGSIAINAALDAIDAALTPSGADASLGRQTLGGAVHDCKITAVPVRDPGDLDGDFLVLGAQTRLAKVGAALDKPRLVALLAAAHGRSIAASSLRCIGRAVEKWRHGDKLLAQTHIALSGLGKLANPKEDAWRLFVADSLIQAGADPSVIVKGLGLDPASFDETLDKYNPDQPRVPAGGPDGGQWTSGDLAGTTNSPTQSPSPGRRNSPPTAAPNSPPRHKDLPFVDAAYQGEYHDFLRDQFAEVLRKAGNTVLKEVAITLPGDLPVTAKIDILARTPTGDVFGIEVKTGNDPTFTDGQRIVYPHAEAGDIVISNDVRIGALMLTPGVPWPHIDLFVLYASHPGAPLEVRRMRQYMQ